MENEKGRKVLKMLINVILLSIIFALTFLVFVMPRDDRYPDTYSENVTIVLRFFSFFEFLASSVWLAINRKKIVLMVFLLFNFITLYKVVDTFFLFHHPLF